MEVVNAVESIDKHVLHRDVVGLDGFVGNFEEFFLGATDEFLNFDVVFVGFVGDIGAGFDEAAAKGGLFDEVGVGFDMGGGGDKVGELGEIWVATNVFQSFLGF